jgi:hypothetical protein
VSHEEPLPATSDCIQIRWEDEREFVDWIGTVSANQDEFNSLAANPDYTLYQAREHARKRDRRRRAKNGVLKFLRQLQLGKIHHGTPG